MKKIWIHLRKIELTLVVGCVVWFFWKGIASRSTGAVVITAVSAVAYAAFSLWRSFRLIATRRQSNGMYFFDESAFYFAKEIKAVCGCIWKTVKKVEDRLYSNLSAKVLFQLIGIVFLSLIFDLLVRRMIHGKVNFTNIEGMTMVAIGAWLATSLLQFGFALVIALASMSSKNKAAILARHRRLIHQLSGIEDVEERLRAQIRTETRRTGAGVRGPRRAAAPTPPAAPTLPTPAGIDMTEINRLLQD
jgi:hypothetical protein